MILLEFFRVKRFFLIGVLGVESFSSVLIFTFSVIIVCEASVGISLIVGLTRSRGDEIVEI